VIRISRIRYQTRIGLHQHILSLKLSNRGPGVIIRREIVVSVQSLPASLSQISFTSVSSNYCFVAAIVYDAFSSYGQWRGFLAHLRVLHVDSPRIPSTPTSGSSNRCTKVDPGQCIGQSWNCGASRYPNAQFRSCETGYWPRTALTTLSILGTHR
jgi:hypothetical protein